MKLTTNQLQSVIARVSTGSSRSVVLVDVSGRRDLPLGEHNSNIYCLDDEAHIVWKVDAPVPRFDRDSFVSLQYRDGKLRADRFSGAEFLIDAETGKAEEIGWHK